MPPPDRVRRSGCGLARPSTPVPPRCPTPFTIDPAAELDALDAFYDDTGAYLDDLADDELLEPVPSVSDWSPAQHLYHIRRANASMLKAANVLGRLGALLSRHPSLSECGSQSLFEPEHGDGAIEYPLES